MNWKLKAAIQKFVSHFPSSASYQLYYWIQRHFGGLRCIDPTSRLIAGIQTVKRIQEQGCSPSGKVFFEIGTGRVPLVPLAYWLVGAERTISIDLNPYLKVELIAESLGYISDNQEIILGLFDSLIDKKRFNELLRFARDSRGPASDFLDLCHVEYIAPGDAANTGLPSQCIDFHTSYAVFEHVPPDLLQDILKEGNRIVKGTGLFVHRIDYGDHFAHSDKSISAINFLQYSDKEWSRYAGNRYMYMNRLRHDDFIALFESAGHRMLQAETDVSRYLEVLLESGNLILDEKFSSRSNEILSVTGAWLITKKIDNLGPS